MARLANRLTTLTLKKDLDPGLYADGDGLYLQVSKQKTKAWVFRFMRAGKARKMGLGPVSIQPNDKRITLLQARQKAADARSLLVDGVDPIEVRKIRRAQIALEAAKATTFRECAEQYIEDNKAGWKNDKHAAQWKATLETYAYPELGALSVGGIDTGLVLKVLRPIWHAKPETASRVRGRIETILDWAKASGFRDGENPARWRGHLENVLPAKSKVSEVKHHKAMPYDEVPSFMTKLGTKAEISAKALEFTVLTAARTGEAIGARPSEFNLQTKIWTIPGERMKAKKEHRVPLCDRAVNIISPLIEKGTEYIFEGASVGKPLSNMAMLELVRGMVGVGLTVHGFRSSFFDWGHDVTGHPKELLDIALAHTVSDKVEAAYRRSDMFEKRRRLMRDWSEFCGGRDEALRAQKVVAMRSSS
ncbi:integrase arm-type DNA-binding domain-containing protein [Bradyrhizobium septentrionale]|uniref:tyrosine-type recombinase/integrase n=1 Tax=Bradyrhizobium septentrionale TaxID=1404411 RepID=UPI0015967D25|nr:integrase arm-type DNA-binding domain-containing protein [Bradyrhizobium septentrionale]UGY27171.1 integrase arm-type DNA-binding domain-containing protein [Bradyrhizobium septentrionale]